LNSVQSMFDAAGPQAARVLDLWWLMLAVCLAVFVAILVFFGLALWRAPKTRGRTAPDLTSLEVPERGARAAVAAAVAASVGLLIVLMLASFVTDRALANLPPPDLRIELVAHRWWWEARYDASDPSKTFSTANEIHIPVGRSVLLELKADDVIHSFWVPNLGGKKDLIPGRTATLALRADKPGIFRGQCAEFCGAQHAKMATLVVAMPPEEYEAWAEAQRKSAPDPASELQVRGRELFVTGTCAMCHTIQGTPANARRAPDLTHLASRQTLAAGTIPNTRGHLAGWILDPQGIKPGVNMPANPMPPQDLDALIAYLETLK
jgi:cytochrome c oxidase subunit II